MANNDIPRIVRGNDFAVRVLVTRAVPRDGKTTQEQIDLSRCTSIVARRVTRLGRRIDMAYAVDGSRILIDFTEDVPSGAYGLEVAGKWPSGADWRFYLQPGEFLEIVEPTSEGYTDGATVKDIYDFTTTVLSETLDAKSLTELREAAGNANAAAGEASSAATAANVAASKAGEAISGANAAAGKADDAAGKANEATASLSGKTKTMDDAESARVEAEKMRVSAENQRDIHEAQRLKEETARAGAENARDTAENDRNTAEGARVGAEAARQDAETARRDAEVTRGNNETERAKAEAARQAAETARQDAEAKRVSVSEEEKAAISHSVSTTYAELKALRDGGKLTPGRYYRITDYECTTTQEGTRSAGHPFDIIVKADSQTVLNEEGRAALHDGDTYFAKAHLEAWKVWYTLDNDQTRFGWADTENGKGVVYRLIDNWNNDCSYDFKNILFTIAEKTYTNIYNYQSASVGDKFVWMQTTNDVSGNSPQEGIGTAPTGADQYAIYTKTVTRPAFTDVYTFNADMGGTNADSSVCEQLHNGLVTQKNVIGLYYDMSTMKRLIPKNVFCVYASDAQDKGMGLLLMMTLANDLGNEADGNVFCHGAIANSVLMAFTDNYFANISLVNTFSGDVDECTFSGNVYLNTFSGDVRYSTFSGYVYQNTFSGNVYLNTFSGDVENNTFSGYVYQNTFSGNVYLNTFSGYVYQNTFSGYVDECTFSGDLSYSLLEGKCQYCLFPAGNVQYMRQCGETIGESDSNMTAVAVAVDVKYEQVVTANKDGNIVVKTPWI